VVAFNQFYLYIYDHEGAGRVAHKVFFKNRQNGGISADFRFSPSVSLFFPGTFPWDGKINYRSIAFSLSNIYAKIITIGYCA